MNRAGEQVFHSPVQSSFVMPVQAMWKLCKAGKKSVARSNYTTVSE
jgi:hypothetical protein